MPRTVKRDKHLTPGQPLKPGNLSARASLEWDRIASELAESSIQVTPAHRTALSMAATLAADIADAWSHVRDEGAYIAGKNGLVAHPASKRLDALRRDYIKVLAMLGLRTAVAAPDTSKEESLADAVGDE
jgi:phage terminase small subunit